MQPDHLTAPPAADPTPWQIVDAAGCRMASDGTRALVLLEADRGCIFARRAVRGLSSRCVGEHVLPLLNALAGELLQRLDMPAEELGARLRALAGLAHVPQPERVEWAVAELDGVRTYVMGGEIVVTTRDLSP